MTVFRALEWLLAAVVLVIFYRMVIAPFAKRMLAVKSEEEPPPSKIVFDEDAYEPYDNSKELRRRVERSLDISSASLEERIKYEELIKRLKQTVEESPDEASTTIGSLVKG